jgi:hypothetical protein
MPMDDVVKFIHCHDSRQCTGEIFNTKLLLSLWATVLDSRCCLVDGEDKDLCNINVRGTGRRPDDLLSDISGSHWKHRYDMPK